MSDDAPPVVPIGSCLRNRFELVEVIGQGGMSTVYRARDRIAVRARDENPDVAIKVIRSSGQYDEALSELLHREARLLRALVHDNLVRVYDSDVHGRYHFLVMELLKGRSLAAIMLERNGRPFPLHLALRIIRSVGSGLEHMHRLGILHGDLKPANVFLTTEGEIKILDFGTALPLDPVPLNAGKPETAHPIHRVDPVTPAYASVEMLAGHPRAEGDDVYSLAVLAYYALAGAHPFQGRSADEARRKNLAPAPPVALSPDRWRVLASALAFDRDSRPATVGQLIERLARPRWRDRVFRRA